MAAAAFGFSQTLETVMATPPRPPAGSTDLNDILHFNPHIIADPVPWWWLQHLDKDQVNKPAQISMQRQKEVLAAQSKAVRPPSRRPAVDRRHRAPFQRSLI